MVEMISMEEEYKKTGIRPSDIAELRQWLKTQPHLPEKYITDYDLLLAYYCCYNSSAVAKQVLDINFTLRTLFTNLFQNRLVDENVIKTLDVICAFPLEVPSIGKKYRIIYNALIDHDTKNFNFIEALRSSSLRNWKRRQSDMEWDKAGSTALPIDIDRRTALMLMDVTQYRDGTAAGYLILIDLNGVTLGHITKLDLQTVQQLIYFLQEAILIRLKGVHFLNAPSYVDRLMMILKSFIKKELMSMVCVHSAGASTIDKIIPIEALPKEAGGKAKSYEEARQESIELLLSNKEFFINENKKRVTESLRPGKPKTITDIFGGIEGSFKKLDID